MQDMIEPSPECSHHNLNEASTQTAACFMEDCETQAPMQNSVAVEACTAWEVNGHEAESILRLLESEEAMCDCHNVI